MTGKKVRELRKKYNMTMKELADKSGTASSYISDIENGKIKKPSGEKLKKIAEVFGVTTDDLLNAHEKAKCELENALLKGNGNIPELVKNYEVTAKEDSINRFHELVELLDWKKFKNINDDDIYEILMSEELYSYLDYLFFKNKNK